MKSNDGGRFYLVVNATQQANMSRVATWATQPDAYIHGWFSFDWTDGYRRLVSATMNSQRTSLNVTLQPEHGGDVQESLQLAKRGARFYGMNMLSELDYPEEYLPPGNKCVWTCVLVLSQPGLTEIYHKF